MTWAGVVVPIRAFALGKARLAEHLTTDERAILARRLADRVIEATGDLPVVVVSSDAGVTAWAAEHGVAAIADPGSLDAAAAAGRAWARDQGCTRVVVAHADLPRARSFAGVVVDADRPVVTLVPCHRDDGTPVLSLPTAAEFDFSYGDGSFRRHVAEARRRGLAVRVVRDPDLAFDVDTADDLARVPEWLMR
jgi:2-phospho-L-lactate guanylyltransferase